MRPWLLVVAAITELAFCSKEDRKVAINPLWVTLTGFSNKNQFVRGVLALPLRYLNADVKGISDVRGVILVTNFQSDATSRVDLATLTDSNGTVSTAIQFIGEFGQSLKLSCYPFDVQTLDFNIVLVHPGSTFLRFQLMCPEHLGSHATVQQGSGEITTCTTPLDYSAGGFEWDAFTCTLIQPAAITCQMKGTRSSSIDMEKHFLPAMVFCAMSAFVFALSIKFAGPRVSTTMIAMVNLSFERNSVIENLPAVGEHAWMTDCFTAGLVLMAVHMLTHYVSSRLDRVNSRYSEAIDELSGTIVSSCFLIYMLHGLYARNCANVHGSLLIWVIVSYLVLATTIGILVWRFSDVFKAVITRRAVGDISENEKVATLDLPPMTDSLQRLLHGCATGIFPSHNQKLIGDFANALQQQWIVSSDQLVGEGSVTSTTIAQSTGLPLALCSELIAVAAK
eukprot:TRINITY_DN25110_c0_g1_i1.p1 TRINITY_DN25110_c0_g1~~TRINITY_DN25110_c0_g1_i1.p1  ORF type:complete len:451 (-),score=37.55 TRINITY_DN25110_c0_g1_i1:23-1375(-)